MNVPLLFICEKIAFCSFLFLPYMQEIKQFFEDVEGVLYPETKVRYQISFIRHKLHFFLNGNPLFSKVNEALRRSINLLMKIISNINTSAIFCGKFMEYFTNKLIQCPSGHHFVEKISCNTVSCQPFINFSYRKSSEKIYKRLSTYFIQIFRL